MSALRSNELIIKAVLTLRKAGKSPLDYLKITIEQGRVTGLSIDAGDRAFEPAAAHARGLAGARREVLVGERQPVDDARAILGRVGGAGALEREPGVDVHERVRLVEPLDAVEEVLGHLHGAQLARMQQPPQLERAQLVDRGQPRYRPALRCSRLRSVRSRISSRVA